MEQRDRWKEKKEDMAGRRPRGMMKVAACRCTYMKSPICFTSASVFTVQAIKSSLDLTSRVLRGLNTTRNEDELCKQHCSNQLSVVTLERG